MSQTGVPFPTAWYLTRVEAPDGKFITLEYEQDWYMLLRHCPERHSGGTSVTTGGTSVTTTARMNQAIMRTAILGPNLKTSKVATSK
jgi:hypothetical protein